MENFKKPKTILSVLVLGLVSAYFNSNLNSLKTGLDESLEANSQPEVIEKMSKRRPASVQLIKAEIYKPGITRTAVEKTNYQDESVPDTFEHQPAKDTTIVQTPFSISSKSQHVLSESNENHTPPTPNQKREETHSSLGPSTGAAIIKEPVTLKIVPPLVVSDDIIPAPLPTIIPNTCSASVSGGSFNHPIGVTLSCSSASDIKYCLSIDTGNGCCDPHTAGIAYNSKIGIGASDANYCLSFFGDSPLLGMSDLYQQSYTISSILPDLQIGHPQNYYQTTQLAGKSYLSSQDFGKVGFGAGVINLKNHDPSVVGENLNCTDIAQNYSALLAPPPLEILSLLDVSLENPATQLEIPLRLDQLEYGTNYITGYMLNDNYDLPLYSCSTSTVVLSDFDFFEQQLAFGDPGNNSTREFSGGLTSFGFFESDATIYRGPAGNSTEEKNGEKLQYGMFGIFY